MVGETVTNAAAKIHATFFGLAISLLPIPIFAPPAAALIFIIALTQSGKPPPRSRLKLHVVFLARPPCFVNGA